MAIENNSLFLPLSTKKTNVFFYKNLTINIPSRMVENHNEHILYTDSTRLVRPPFPSHGLSASLSAATNISHHFRQEQLSTAEGKGRENKNLPPTHQPAARWPGNAHLSPAHTVTKSEPHRRAKTNLGADLNL